MAKVCTGECGELKELDDFGLKSSSSDGRNSQCLSCAAASRARRRSGWNWTPEQQKAAEKKWKADNPEKQREYDRRRNLKRNGLTDQDYADMLEKQDGKCAICERPEEDLRRMAVDHCHSTMQVRGLLCDRCNRGLGFFGDDTGRLMKAIEYLQKAETA